MEITWLHNVGCILQEIVKNYPIHKALVADFDAAVTRMTIYKQYDWSFYVIFKDMFEKSFSRRNT